jgi:hypothetical protein
VIRNGNKTVTKRALLHPRAQPRETKPRFGQSASAANMPRNPDKSDRFLMLNENLSVVAVSHRRSQRRRTTHSLKRPRQSWSPTEIEEPMPPSDSNARLRRLLMAALRLWELKNGIHDYF